MLLSPEQQLSIDSYENLVCYLLSFRKAANGLFGAWVQAKDMITRGTRLNYTFNYLGHVQTFSWCQLAQFEQASRCPSLNELLLNSNTLEGVATVLFKIRIQLMGLYNTYIYSKEMRARGTKYIYTFVNPFIDLPNASNLGMITGVFKMPTDCIIRLFECCNIFSSNNGGDCPTITITGLSDSTTYQPNDVVSFQYTSFGGSGSYTYSVISGSLPTGLTLSSSGLLSGTITASLQTYNFSISSIDSNNCVGLLNQSIRVFSCSITITGSFTQNPSYIIHDVNNYLQIDYLPSNEEFPPYNWSINAGSLPTGVSLIPNGLTGARISGIPTDSGNYIYDLYLNYNSCTTRIGQSIIIVCNTFSIQNELMVPTNLNNGSMVSNNYTVSGGTGPFAWSHSGDLPNGLSINAVSGLLSGTITGASIGTYYFAIYAVDMNDDCLQAVDQQIIIS